MRLDTYTPIFREVQEKICERILERQETGGRGSGRREAGKTRNQHRSFLCGSLCTLKSRNGSPCVRLWNEPDFFPLLGFGSQDLVQGFEHNLEFAFGIIS